MTIEEKIDQVCEELMVLKESEQILHFALIVVKDSNEDGIRVSHTLTPKDFTELLTYQAENYGD